MIVKCVSKPVFWGTKVTVGKEYEVNEYEEFEYWLHDDNGNYSPFFQDCFSVVEN